VASAGRRVVSQPRGRCDPRVGSGAPRACAAWVNRALDRAEREPYHACVALARGPHTMTMSNKRTLKPGNNINRSLSGRLG
jgi:hypothetical protein